MQRLCDLEGKSKDTHCFSTPHELFFTVSLMLVPSVAGRIAWYFSLTHIGQTDVVEITFALEPRWLHSCCHLGGCTSCLRALVSSQVTHLLGIVFPKLRVNSFLWLIQPLSIRHPVNALWCLCAMTCIKAGQKLYLQFRASNSNAEPLLTHSETLLMCFPMSWVSVNTIKKSFAPFEVALVNGGIPSEP